MEYEAFVGSKQWHKQSLDCVTVIVTVDNQDNQLLHAFSYGVRILAFWCDLPAFQPRLCSLFLINAEIQEEITGNFVESVCSFV